MWYLFPPFNRRKANMITFGRHLLTNHLWNGGNLNLRKLSQYISGQDTIKRTVFNSNTVVSCNFWNVINGLNKIYSNKMLHALLGTVHKWYVRAWKHRINLTIALSSKVQLIQSEEYVNSRQLNKFIFETDAIGMHCDWLPKYVHSFRYKIFQIGSFEWIGKRWTYFNRFH